MQPTPVVSAVASERRSASAGHRRAGHRRAGPSRRARRRRTVALAGAVLLLGGGWFALFHGGPPAVVVAPAPQVEVRAGQTADTVAAAIIAATGWSQSAVAGAFADPRAAGVPGTPASIEGWLAPGVYPVAKTDTPGSLAAAMVAHQLARLDATGVTAAAAREHRSVTDLVTIASIAQAEAIPSQYGQVARVITNRLRRDMPLQMDATLNYAHGTHVLAHTDKQLMDASAYNSYTRHGLPPTPIGNPDERALTAAAHAPPGTWLYFVLVDKDGTQLFTADFAEFTRAKAKAHAAGLF